MLKLTKAQKHDLIELFKAVDVKKLEIQHENDKLVKFFRFGSYNGLQIASEIVKAIDVDVSDEKKIPVSKK